MFEDFQIYKHIYFILLSIVLSMILTTNKQIDIRISHYYLVLATPVLFLKNHNAQSI